MAVPLKLGIAGLGTVGASVVRMIERQRDALAVSCGRPIEVVAVTARSRSKKRDIDLKRLRWVADPVALATDGEIDVFVELIGGEGDPAKAAIAAALAAKKSVVTANKALLARHGVGLAAIAEKSHVTLNFEAAVGGAIPIVKTLREGLAGNSLARIYGILNGTCNYILTRMEQEKLSFADCLKEAQRLGYAEADPSFDIEGHDTAQKLSILASLTFGIRVDPAAIYVEGITSITTADLEAAEELGYRIKLLGISRRTDKGIELRVHPTLIPEKRLLANVEGAMNAVVVHGDAVGTTLYYGKGAGAEPTASAVVADLVDVTRLHTADPEHRVPHLAFQPDSLANTPILPIEEVTSSYYLRLRVADVTGVLANITRILADKVISIDALLQKESEHVDGEDKGETDIILLTHETVEREINAAITQIEALSTVVSKVTKLRMEGLN